MGVLPNLDSPWLGCRPLAPAPNLQFAAPTDSQQGPQPAFQQDYTQKERKAEISELTQVTLSWLTQKLPSKNYACKGWSLRAKGKGTTTGIVDFIDAFSHHINPCCHLSCLFTQSSVDDIESSPVIMWGEAVSIKADMMLCA